MSFLIKYFATQQVSTANFLASWYSGAFVGALFLYLFKRPRLIKTASNNFFLYALFILSTFGAMAGSFVALILAPAAIVLPLHSFLFVVGVVAVAFWVFGEGKKFDRREKAGLVLGLIGGILLSIRSYWQN